MSKHRAHGANPDKVYINMGLEMPERIIDFSTNTNPLPWYGELDFNLMGLLSGYPDDEAAWLRDLLALKNGCSAGEILITNGSNEAIYLLASYCSPAATNHILQPTYGEYERALAAWGIESTGITDLGGLMSGAGSVWMCNPNNPTGVWTRPDVISKLLAGHPETLFIVDEAYIDFLAADTRQLRYSDFPNLIVLRSLTKFYHLCGARLGYVMADREVIQKLRRRQPTWSVNSIAQAVAAVLLRDEDYQRRTREFYRTETPRFIGRLRAAGFNVRPTCVHFFLLETEDDERLITYLLRLGLVVRHTRNFQGLDGNAVRIATRLPSENDILVDAMKEFRSREFLC